MVAAVGAAAAGAGVDLGETVNEGGWPQVERFFAAAASPRLDGAFLSLTADAALTTLAFAALATVLSVGLGIVGGVLAARVFWRRPLPWLGLRAALAVPRGIHEVVWGLLLLAIIGLDPLVAVLAIAIPYAAVTAKVFSEMLDEAPRGPYDALVATGARRLPAVVYALMPFARADLTSYAFYRFECAIRSAAVLGLVGAGGIGFQMALSFQSLRYDELWTLIYALVVLSGAADAWSSAVRRHRERHRVGSLSLLVGAFLVVTSAAWVGLDPSALLDGEVSDRAADVATGFLPPELPDGGWSELASLSLETLAMSVLAGAFAFAGGALLAFPAARGARGVGPPAVGLSVRALLLFLRAVPPPVWALVALFVLYPGIWPGAIALGLYNLGVVGRLMAEAVENLDPSPAHALRSAGASRAGTFLYASVPAAAGRFVAFGAYRWEVAVRETIVVGAVGAGGLGLALQQQLARFDYGAVSTTVSAIVALTLAVDLASAALRRVVAGSGASA
jgi:phosphonate transport system permease protein